MANLGASQNLAPPLKKKQPGKPATLRTISTADNCKSTALDRNHLTYDVNVFGEADHWSRVWNSSTPHLLYPHKDFNSETSYDLLVSHA